LAVATQFNHINNHAPIADIHATTVKFHKLNHHGSQAPRMKSQPAKAKSTVTCYKCNCQGHYSHDCRSAASSVLKVSTDRSTAARSTVKSRPQYKQAITFTRSDVDTLLKVEGSIVGTHLSPVRLLCTLDSAASVSMISEVTARHYGFTILPSDVRIKSTNNAVTAVIGTTDMVTVDIQGHSCQLTLVVLEHDDHEVLLGLDWFMATGASLHPKSHTLQFPGTVVQLHSPHHSEDINSCNAEDDFILSVSVADEDDISGDVDWHANTTIKMQPLAKLSAREQTAFAKLEQVAVSSFATDYDSMGFWNISKHEIRLQSRVSIYSHPYRKSLREREMNLEIKKLIEAKIIRQSRSPYASPVILVPKKDGSVRMCVDYRRLNLETIPEQWSLPRIADILDNMLGFGFQH